jgi:hypothetical protein
MSISGTISTCRAGVGHDFADLGLGVETPVRRPVERRASVGQSERAVREQVQDTELG